MAALAFAMVLAATGLLGIGFGATLTAINAYAASFFPHRGETAITALHTLLGTGTALAPLVVSLLSEGGAWFTGCEIEGSRRTADENTRGSLKAFIDQFASPVARLSFAQEAT